MMSKIFVTLLALALVAVACTAPPAEVPRAQAATPTGQAVLSASERPIDLASSQFNFTGYGPGKSHDGTFTRMSGVLLYEDGAIVGARGTIDASSVSTGIERLDGHLQSADFFDVAAYPEITMESRSIADGQLTGTLMFHGVTKELTFPVVVTQNSISGDVIISMQEFNISYPGANDEVRVRFNLTA